MFKNGVGGFTPLSKFVLKRIIILKNIFLFESTLFFILFLSKVELS